MFSIRRYLFSTSIAMLFIVTFISTINVISYNANQHTIINTIQNDLDTGAVKFPTAWNRSISTGIDTWTDCLVLEIATYPKNNNLYSFSRAQFYSFGPGTQYSGSSSDNHKCSHLSEKLHAQSFPGRVTVDYWRYWWGSAQLLNIAIGYAGLSLPAYQQSLKIITYLLILLVGISALVRYRRGAWPFIPFTLAVCFGFELPLFGQSIAHAPSLIAGLLLILIYIVTKIDRTNLYWQFGFFFIVGGIVFYFELLNGNLVAILVFTALLRLVSVRAGDTLLTRGPEWLTPWPRSSAVASAMAAYFAGAVSTAVLRILLRAMFMNQSVFETFTEWRLEAGKYSSERLLQNQMGWKALMQRCYWQIEDATFPYIGRHGIVAIYGICTLIYLAMCVRLLLRTQYLDRAARDTTLAAAFVIIIVPMWYGAFMGHAVVHPWMMMRLLSLFFALAPSVGLIVIADDIDRRRANVIPFDATLQSGR